MRARSLLSRRVRAAGFTLPAILVVVSALLILAVGILLVAGTERSTARAFVERQRADLAVRAGLEEVRGILAIEAANDDFLILQHTQAPVAKKDPIAYLYLARGSGGGKSLNFHYVPLFSTAAPPGTGGKLEAPAALLLLGEEPAELTTLPWCDPARISWISIRNPDGKTVSRYAYWVEDMQGKIDGRVAGNEDGEGGVHARPKFPHPPAKARPDDAPPMSAMALHVLDPESGDQSKTAAADGKTLTRKVIAGRPAMLSPESMVGAAGFRGPDGSALLRAVATGLLTNPAAAALERDVSPVNRSYQEQALVPFAPGLSAKVTGKPKLNLNQLLAESRSSAVDAIAARIDEALPDFAGKRRGGFPDDYLKTLSAGALDYADSDSDPTIGPGSYLGLDAYPLLSEIVLHIDFLGTRQIGSRYVLAWRFKLFAELWNMTNQPVSGACRLSYEVNLQPETIGASAQSLPFDDPSILLDPAKSNHNLTRSGGGKFRGPLQTITLSPDEYRFHEFASVDYTLDYAPTFNSKGQMKTEEFDLLEPELGMRGVTLFWNEQAIQTITSISRDPYGVSNFRTTQPRVAAKAAIPGHSYGPYGFFVNNMGDPRIAHYLRTTRLGENSYPENISPNRRNIRRFSVYDRDPSTAKRNHFGRVLPSEWPDGGHDSPTGAFEVIFKNAILPTDPAAWPPPPVPLPENALQRISNLGRFYSVTELGRVYDPVLWKPAYKDLKGQPGSGAEDTGILSSIMPIARNAWPEVTLASTPSTDHGGGNTLRIGRPEHERFDRPGERAAQLLDLFHAGIPNSNHSDEREGNLIEINGHINVNTSNKNALRAMAAGLLAQDPELRRVTGWEHDTTSGAFRPQTAPLELGAPTFIRVADRIADAIVLRRPFASTSELAAVLDENGNPVFGNRDVYPDFKDIQWSDAAAEEVFARVYEASTVRSRNFRVWVIGQSVSGLESRPEILAESRKVFTVFADPGERRADGTIDPAKHRPRVTYENDF